MFEAVSSEQADKGKQQSQPYVQVESTTLTPLRASALGNRAAEHLFMPDTRLASKNRLPLAHAAQVIITGGCISRLA